MVSYFWGGGNVEKEQESWGAESVPTEADKYQTLTDQTFSFGAEPISGKYVFLSRRYVYAMVAQ